MPEVYRTPKAVLVEDPDLPAHMDARGVLALRTRGGAAGEWADRVASRLQERAAIIEENHMAVRAVGPDAPLAEGLAYLLNEAFEFYSHAHRAHWNVVGSGADFQSFHELFGEVYEDTYSSIDPIAENIRKLGSLAPCLHVEPEGDPRMSAPGDLAAMLLEENEELLASLRLCFDMATAAGQQGVANFLAERQDMHSKWSWQLRASLGIAEVGEPLPPEASESEVEEEDLGQYSADPEVEARRSLLEACEKRSIPAELRAETMADGKIRVRGYAAVFNQESTGLPFREVIAPGAFARSLQRGDDVFLLVNHDTDQLPLARRSSGTLSLSEDENGLLIDAELDPANPRAAEVASVLGRQDASEMSFAFKVAEGGSRKRDDGVRELSDLDLFEVSIVTWGAYNQTTVGLRSAEGDDTAALRARRARLRQRQLGL